MGLSTIFVLQNTGVNTEGALRRFGNNSGLYGHFLAKSLSDPTSQDVTNASEAEDAQTALAPIHTLKGLTANPGLTRLYGISSKMMDCIRGDKFTKAFGKYGELKRAYNEICGIPSKA